MTIAQLRIAAQRLDDHIRQLVTAFAETTGCTVKVNADAYCINGTVKHEVMIHTGVSSSSGELRTNEEEAPTR